MGRTEIKLYIVRCILYVALTGGHILGQISTKLGMMDGCRVGMVTVSGPHGPVITAVTVG